MFREYAGAGKSLPCQVLNHHGFDDMETLLCMEDEHMREMGIATGHILKLKRPSCFRTLAGDP